MNTIKEFKRIMDTQTEIALATVVTDGTPNVRIVNYYFNPTNNVLYFSTFKDNEKVKEIKQNRNVAFTTIPQKGNEHIKARGIALRSEKTVFDLADCFCDKIPGYKNTIDFAGDSLILYEIHFKTATVTLNLSDIQTITL
jgi:hypothetical protein